MQSRTGTILKTTVPTLLERKSQGYLDSIAKQKSLLEKIAKQLNIKELPDWYIIDPNIFGQSGGNGLLTEHGGSLSRMLHQIYPQFPWEFWKFKHNVRGYFSESGKQKLFLQSLAMKLGIKETKDWYNVKTSDVIENGGWGLLNHFGGSLSKALAVNFPDVDWKPWLFNKVPDGYWDDKNNIKHFLHWLSIELNIQEPENWRNISRTDFIRFGGKTLLKKYGSLNGVLSVAYPHQEWKIERHPVSPDHVSQQSLFKSISQIFPIKEAT